MPYEVTPAEIAERAAREVYEFGLASSPLKIRPGQPLLNLLNTVARLGQPLNGVYSVLAPGGFGTDFLLIDVSGEVLSAYKALIAMPGIEIICELAGDPHPFDVETVWQHGGDVRWITPFRGIHCGVECGQQPHWVKSRVLVLPQSFR